LAAKGTYRRMNWAIALHFYWVYLCKSWRSVCWRDVLRAVWWVML